MEGKNEHASNFFLRLIESKIIITAPWNNESKHLCTLYAMNNVVCDKKNVDLSLFSAVSPNLLMLRSKDTLVYSKKYTEKMPKTVVRVGRVAQN